MPIAAKNSWWYRSKLHIGPILWLNAEMTAPNPNDKSQQRTLRAFAALVTGEDAAIDLALAALLIASTAYPDLDIAHYMAELESLAQRVRRLLDLPEASTLPPETDQVSVIMAINTVLFEQEHFYGNTQDYYNPDNSFLNRVLERHTGIPIALSLVYMEVGKRVGISLEGIGLPFHFVVGCRLPHGRIYIDPYEAGRIYNEQECRERVRHLLGGKGRMQASWFEPVSRKYLLVRMLSNLKHIYLRTENYAHALAMCDRIILLIPRSPVEWHDRGAVHLQLKHYTRAIKDLNVYLELAPKAEDREEVEKQIKAIRNFIAMLN
jgi:regulator of sirC expression with transglutaminase-like and TPR domain